MFARPRVKKESDQKSKSCLLDPSFSFIKVLTEDAQR